jgi:hypothetical protein
MKPMEEDFFFVSKCVEKKAPGFQFPVFISSHYEWLPYKVFINGVRERLKANNPQAEFLEISAWGLHSIDVSGNRLNEKRKVVSLISLFLSISFWAGLVQLGVSVTKLAFRFTESKQLAGIRIANIKIGDILASEYLRSPKHGNGKLRIDLRYFAIAIKYLIVYVNLKKDVRKILSRFKASDISFSIQETSFKDEMRRRVLNDLGVRSEYHYDKIMGKLVLFQYMKGAEGRVLEYTHHAGSITEEEIAASRDILDKRVYGGSQPWTRNVTDVDISAEVDLPAHLDESKPVAIIFLHCVADDQYRCGLDEFQSLDHFHTYTIDKLLAIGYQCIIKPHPTAVSALHPDKTRIDGRYLSRLLSDYGLDYQKLLTADINSTQTSLSHPGLFSMHPRLPIKSIAEKIKFLAISNHGNITFEAQHLGVPTVKYRYCKNREYSFCHDWSLISEYEALLVYYSRNGALPETVFPDSYLKVIAVLARKKAVNDYNIELLHATLQYDENLPLQVKPKNSRDERANFDLIRNKLATDQTYREYIKMRFNRFYNW